MKAFGKILAYLAATILLGALLAPLLFHLGRSVGAARGWNFLSETDFQRYFNRSALIAAALLLWPALRWLGVHDVRDWRAAAGLEKNPRALSDLAFGLIAGFLAMAALGGGLVQLGLYRWKAEPPFGALGAIALSAIVVAVIEEALFRAGIMGLIRRSAPPLVALLLVSALYSIVHFLKSEDAVIDPGEVHWFSGFVLLPGSFWQFGDPMLLLGGFTTLFALGVILGFAALRTKSLWLPIGLHAGLVFAKFGFGKLTKRQGELWPWFGRDLQVGLGPLATLALLGLATWLWIRLTRLDHERPAPPRD